MSRYLVGAYAIGAAAPPASPTAAQAQSKAAAATAHASKTISKLPSKYSALKSKLQSASAKVSSGAQALSAKKPTAPVKPTTPAARAAAANAAVAAATTRASTPPPTAATGIRTPSTIVQQRTGVAVAPVAPPTTVKLAPHIVQPRLVLGQVDPSISLQAPGMQTAIVSTMYGSDILDDLATLGDIVAALTPTIAQLTSASQTTFANSGQAIVNQAQSLISNYDPNDQSASTARQMDVQSGNLSNAATAWQGQVQAATGIAPTTAAGTDASYEAQAQAIVALITPVVAQLTAAGQTSLAQQGQGLIAQAQAIASGSGSGSVSESATTRGAM